MKKLLSIPNQTLMTEKNLVPRLDINENKQYDDSVEQNETSNHEASKADVRDEHRTKIFIAIEYWDGQRARGHFRLSKIYEK